MILLCAEGLQSKGVTKRIGMHEHTVGKWCRRFVKDRIEGLWRPLKQKAIYLTELQDGFHANQMKAA